MIGDPSGPLPESPPAPRPGRWAALPWVWAVPILAVLIAGWLGLRSLAERGATITIVFENAEGIEAGRTRIRYKNVDLGVVSRVQLSNDHSHVVLTADMSRDAEPMLRQDTQFWVVRPRVGLAGISGLTTLVSGAYIGMLPGKAEQAEHSFTGLETPPPAQGLGGGQEYALVSETMPSVSDESPIYYHGVQVGEVVSHALSDQTGAVSIKIFIYQPHRVLVHPSSRFWVSSGFQASVGSQGLRVGTESLRTLLAGGIVFDTPAEAMAEPPSLPGTVFRLFPDRAAADDAADPVRVSYRAFFPGSLRGVDIGTAVELRGIPVGRVSGVRLEYDPAAAAVRIPVTIEIMPKRIGLAAGATPDNLGPNPVEATNEAIARLVQKGLRAQVASGNLLTGQRVVALDFVENAAPASLVMAEPYPELPTVGGGGLEDIARSASQLMDKLAALPLPELVGAIRDMVVHADELIASPEIKRSLRSLDRTLVNVERITREAQPQLGALLASLHAAADQLRATLTLLGNDPRASTDLARTLDELKNAARSIRVLADYLERHPESLLRGKPQEAAR